MGTSRRWRIVCENCGKVFFRVDKPAFSKSACDVSEKPGVFSVSYQIVAENEDPSKCEMCGEYIAKYVTKYGHYLQIAADNILSDQFCGTVELDQKRPTDFVKRWRAKIFQAPTDAAVREQTAGLWWRNFEVFRCPRCAEGLTQKSWVEDGIRHLHSDCSTCGMLSKMQWKEG